MSEATVPAVRRRGVVASPVAKRVATEHGLDVAGITGSGRRGRICKADVLSALERRTPIAEHMIRSRRTAAHMTTETDVDMTAVARAGGERDAGRDARIPALAFVARAACTALEEFPDLNASFDGRRLIRWREVNLGIVVDTDGGPAVPVIRRAARLTARAMADEIAGVAARAREGTLDSDHVRAGTFTICNPGSAGGTSAMAIINQPQVAILGLPAIVRRPVVVVGDDGAEVIAPRPITTLALTFDHRVVDGAYATRCVVRIKQLLEDFVP